MSFKTALITIFYSIMRMKSMFALYKRLFWLIISLKVSIFLITYIVNCSSWISINTKIHSISLSVSKTFISTFLMCYYISNWKPIFSFFFYINLNKIYDGYFIHYIQNYKSINNINIEPAFSLKYVIWYFINIIINSFFEREKFNYVFFV